MPLCGTTAFMSWLKAIGTLARQIGISLARIIPRTPTNRDIAGTRRDPFCTASSVMWSVTSDKYGFFKSLVLTQGIEPFHQSGRLFEGVPPLYKSETAVSVLTLQLRGISPIE